MDWVAIEVLGEKYYFDRFQEGLSLTFARLQSARQDGSKPEVEQAEKNFTLALATAHYGSIPFFLSTPHI